MLNVSFYDASLDGGDGIHKKTNAMKTINNFSLFLVSTFLFIFFFFFFMRIGVDSFHVYLAFQTKEIHHRGAKHKITKKRNLKSEF